MVAIRLVRPAADDTVDIGDLQPGIGYGVAHRLHQEIQAGDAGHAAKPAVAGADDGANVAQLAGGLDHGAHFAISRRRAAICGGAA